MAVSDLAAPAPHRRRGDALLQQRGREGHAVEAQCRAVEEERTRPGPADHPPQEPAPEEEPNVGLATDFANPLPLLVARPPPGRERRVVDKDDARAVGDARGERFEVGPPLAVDDAERDEPRNGANKPD